MVEHATAMPEMSFPKKPRSGQWSVIEESKRRLMLNAKLPTGYGKTLAACYVYRVKKALGLANRMLVIFPSDSQLEQFVRDGHRDLRDAGIDGPVRIIDIRFAGARARPDIHERVLNGEITANAGMIEAGFRKKRESRKLSTLEKVLRLLPQLTDTERTQLADHLRGTA